LDLSVARQRRHHLIVAQILTPRLELFGSLADLFAEPGQGFPEAVGVAPRLTSDLEGAAKNLPNRIRIGPDGAFEADGSKPMLAVKPNPRGGKERGIVVPTKAVAKLADPREHDLLRASANRKEPGPYRF
jgi:hypothetical protein